MDYWSPTPKPALSFELALKLTHLQMLYPTKSAFIKAVLVTIEGL